VLDEDDYDLQNERTTAKDMLQQKRWRSLLDIREVDALMVYDAFHKFDRR
jgi:hypothetical protein